MTRVLRPCFAPCLSPRETRYVLDYFLNKKTPLQGVFYSYRAASISVVVCSSSQARTVTIPFESFEIV